MPMAASDKALRAIALNAARHLTEGNQHLDAGRIPSATASAILSAEELGKFVLQMSSAPLVPLPKKPHAAHGRLLVLVVHALESSGWAAAWGRFRDEELAVGSVDPKLVLRMKEHPEYAEFLLKLEAGELLDPAQRRSAWVSATAHQMTREISEGMAGRATISDKTRILLTEGLQRLRLKATFVDVDKSGEVSNDPGGISEDVARGLCLAVGEVFGAVCKMTGQYRPSLNLSDIESELGADPGSVDVYTRSRLFGAVIDAATG